jgi:S-adenosylmethionine synthetase
LYPAPFLLETTAVDVEEGAEDVVAAAVVVDDADDIEEAVAAVVTGSAMYQTVGGMEDEMGEGSETGRGARNHAGAGAACTALRLTASMTTERRVIEVE